MKIEIWMEGYMATGEHGTAHKMGTYEAENFNEAVEKMLEEKEKLDWIDIRKYYRKSETTGNHLIWACALFDNEQDARKNFG